MLRLGKTYDEIQRICGVSRSYISRRKKQLELQETAKRAEHTAAATAYEESEESENVSGVDARFIMDLVKKRLDPKHPIMVKWIDNVAWWNHIILEFSKSLLPDAFRLLDEHEIDRRNPEVTAANIVKKFRAFMKLAEERAEKLEEYEEKIRALESEVERLRGENKYLRELVKDYKTLVDDTLNETRRAIEDLKSRVVKTIVFIVKYVPEALSPTERSKYYHVVIPKIRELWGAGYVGGRA